MNDYYIFLLRRIDLNKIVYIGSSDNFYHGTNHFKYAFSCFSSFKEKQRHLNLVYLKEQNLIKTEIVKQNLLKEEAFKLVKKLKVLFGLEAPLRRSNQKPINDYRKEIKQILHISNPVYNQYTSKINQVLNSNFSSKEEFLQLLESRS